MTTQERIPLTAFLLTGIRKELKTVFVVQVGEWENPGQWCNIGGYKFTSIEAAQDYITELEDLADKMNIYQFEYRIKEEEV